jgi:hypothetical protein
MRLKLAALFLAALLTMVMIGAALAAPKPPTNGGNGAGQSGQCTGAASARPTACKSK